MTRFALVVAGCLCQLWVLAGQAYAHASLVTSNPAEGQVLAEPPSVLSLTFDEAVTLAPSSTQLYDATGTRVRVEVSSVDGKVTIRPVDRLARGSYVATYALVSADSHPIAGSLAFAVGAPSPRVVPPPQAAAGEPRFAVLRGVLQGLTYVFLLLAAGLALFVAWVLPAVGRLEALRGRLRWILGNSSMLAAVGALGLVPLGGLLDSGGVAFAVMVLLGLALASTRLWDRPPSTHDRLLVSLGAFTALSAPTLVGHTRSFEPALLMLTSDVVHVVAAGVWLGGLVGLAVSLAMLADRDRIAAQVVARFSLLAGGLLALVGLAGVILGWRVLGSWTGLVTTTYGTILLAKVALVLVVVALAGWNRYRLLPRVLRGDSAQRLRGTVRVEAVVLLGVLMLTGFLGNADPRTDELLRAKGRAVSVVDDVRLSAVLGPGTVGPNTITVRVLDLQGLPRDLMSLPSISVVSGGVDLGSRPVRRVGPGRYVAKALIPRPGEWQVLVSMRTGEFDQASMTLQTTVAG